MERTVRQGSLSSAEPQQFLPRHGANLVAPSTNVRSLVGNEAVVRTEPFEPRYTVTIEEESLTPTVDDDLQVIDASEGRRRRDEE